MARTPLPHPRPDFSLMDIFIGSGRTIRKSSGPPGVPRHRSSPQALASRPASLREGNGAHSKPGSAKAASNANGNSIPSSTKEEAKVSGSKAASAKAASNDKAASTKSASKNKSANESKTNGDKTADPPKANGDKPINQPKTNGHNPSSVVFTAEEDARLLSMNANGAKWNVIALELGKTKKRIMKRFEEIKPTDWKPQKGGKHGINKKGVEVAGEKQQQDDNPTKEPSNKPEKTVEHKAKSNKPEEKQDDKPTKAAPEPTTDDRTKHDHHKHHHHHRHHQDEPHKHRHHDEPHHHHKTHHHHRPLPSLAPSSSSTARFTIKTMPSLAEDDLFSFGELQACSELIGRDMEGMWQRVSAAFFGMTGRRIAPEDIRDKFAGLEGEF